LQLLRKELNLLLGDEVFTKIQRLFGESYDEILIRRCQAHDKFINFHTDVSKRTLQVALNGEDEYVGGRLAYLTKGEMHIPRRPTGSITIHENDIVHGVTKLERGTRYGLFLLKK
jgi:predicted 2-oxoglutarate/Fe(II)-dependent dioxygenase YbiX